MSNFRAPLRVIQTDFRAGEIDPYFSMRVDSQALRSGAQNLENMLIRSTGGAERRPGMVTKANMGPDRVRLFDFNFDADEKYIVALSIGFVRVFIADGTQVASIAAPWVSDTVIWEINFIQKGDVMLLVHTSFKTRRLSRITSVSFALDILAFSSDDAQNVLNQPYLRFAPAVGYNVGLSLYTAGAARTLTVSPGFLTAAWNGERMRIWGKEISIVNVTGATTATVDVKQTVLAELGIAPMRFTNGSTSVEVTHVGHGIVGPTATLIFSNATDGFGLTAPQINGSRLCTITGPDEYWFNAAAAATSGGDGGGANVKVQPVAPAMLSSWMEQVWSDRRGWPGAITLHENRLWLAGSKGAPTFMAGSAVGDYYDFNVRDGLDDESVQGTISATSRILHLVSAKVLQIFTELNEAVVETQNGEPITPGSLKVLTQTSYGADPNVRPQLFDGGTLFSQRNGKNIRELVYDFNTDSQVAPPLSVLATNRINKPNDLAVLAGTATRAEQYAFFINADGTVSVWHSVRAEKLAGWTHFSTRGWPTTRRFDSVCVIGSSVFFSVKDDNTYLLDRFELDATDVWLDSAKQMTSGGATTVWALGLPYANNIVEVMSNGYLLGSFQVDGAGTVTIDTAVTSIVAGYDYGIILIPIAPDKDMNDGTMTGEKRRIVCSTIDFRHSCSAAVNGQEQLGFHIGYDPSLPLPLVSGKRKIRHLGYSLDPTFAITQPNPGRLLVIGMIHEVSI